MYKPVSRSFLLLFLFLLAPMPTHAAARLSVVDVKNAIDCYTTMSMNIISDMDWYEWQGTVYQKQGHKLIITGRRMDPEIIIFYKKDGSAHLMKIDGQEYAPETPVFNYVVSKIRTWEKLKGQRILPVNFTAQSNTAESHRKSTTPPLVLPRVNAEAGTPLYVLEQAEGSSNPAEFSFFVVMPSAGTALGISDSRLLLKHKGLRVKSFGIAGFSITKNEIHSGSLFLLDTQGKLWRSTLDNEDNGVHKPLTFVADHIVKIEAEAESTLIAIDANKRLLAIEENGKVSELATLDNDVLDLHRANDGDLILITTDFKVLEWSFADNKFANPRTLPGGAASPLSARVFGSEVWIAEADRLTSHDLESEQTRSISLTELLQLEQNGGSDFQFLGYKDQTVYAKVGNHIAAFSKTALGSKLSYRLVAPSFFSNDLRLFGVNSGWHSKVSTLQPRLADRKSRWCENLLLTKKTES